MNKVIFLDKDDTLIKNRPYNVRPELMELTGGAGQAMQKLAVMGYRFVVITNQSGVAQGLFSEIDLIAVKQQIQQLLKPFQVQLSGFYYCPHHPKGKIAKYAVACDCRKPESGMINRAAKDLEVDLAGSFMIGDTWEDMAAGQAAGCHTIFLDTYHTDAVLPRLLACASVMDFAETVPLIEVHKRR